MKRSVVWIVAAVMTVGSARGEAVGYADEGAFLAEVARLGLSVEHEGFEEEGVWGGVRSTIVEGNHTSPSVTNGLVRWRANNGSSQVTTSNGAARGGEWGVYSLPHGSYTEPDPGRDPNVPGECGDGLRGEAARGVLYAVGGWWRTNTPVAKMGMFIGQYPENPVDFGETCIGGEENCVDNGTLSGGARFLGVIDEAGFAGFEYRELEGTAEDAKFVFADDFWIAGPAEGSGVRGWVLYQ